jgi:predicted GIY-YIG superfamily endonuclease
MSDEKVYTVYALKDDNEIVYIGSTSRHLSARLREHRKVKRIPSHFHIEKICEAGSRQEAERKEEHLINLIGIHRLMNKTAHQKKGNLGKKHTQHAKDLIRTKLTGLKRKNVFRWSPERRIRSIASMKGVKKRDGAINETLKKLGHKEFDLYKDGQFIGRFVNQTHAASALGMPKSTFVNIFKGIRIKTKGIEVRYV